MPRLRRAIAIALLAWAGSTGCSRAGSGRMQPDTGSADLATHDEAERDSKDVDAPSADAFSSEAAEIETSQRDKGPPEVGSFEAPATEDSGPDAGSFDAPATEDARPDVGSFEAFAPDNAIADAGNGCFACEGYLICGGEITGQINLMPEADGCYLSGLPGRTLLAPDGTLTEGGAVVGKAVSQGAGVDIRSPDGGLWLICRRPRSCDSSG